ncbi:M14 family metallopeptidase [Sediminicola sp. 1XM1-17]|uniref:M14 family metallopeptidase n=1 Tax=Sediminicola sp. 1XM1-17 TaxID=3127702 RepID=UPI00307781FF
MRYFLVFSILCLLLSCDKKIEDKIAEYPTPFEKSNGNQTATYQEVIDFYMQLAKEFPAINVQTIGETDSGKPLHIVTYNMDSDFNFAKIGKDKTIILINNGIHPGESDGIDATMNLFRDLAVEKIDPPKNTVITTIPIYNIDGALNRNSTTRANQNGPEVYGFRGNAQNYDLNRDFIKSDTKNAITFAEIFHLVKPDIFIDNHVSNGADYQYTLTHLFTQHNKLGGDIGRYLNMELRPKLEKSLAASNWDITPYVNVFNEVPEKGFSQFMDSPRYSTGYTTLWNTLGMMVETHMLKPYKKRVEGTYQLMVKMIEIADSDTEKIKEIRELAFSKQLEMNSYPLQWEIDTTKFRTLNFKGFEADTLISEVTGFPRLKYDRNRPFTKAVTYRDRYKPTVIVEVPKAYIIKKGWTKVVDLLAKNQIDYKTLQQDTTLSVESYKIAAYNTYERPYEGHYPHYGTTITKKLDTITFSQGDYLVPTNQPGMRYLLETLEPEAADSFFNWNFFDAILSRKEGFSPYVFEDEALKMLRENPALNAEFQLRKEMEPDFAQNWYAQLDWLFTHSKYYEAAHMQYPVYRLLKDSGIVTK